MSLYVEILSLEGLDDVVRSIFRFFLLAKSFNLDVNESLWELWVANSTCLQWEHPPPRSTSPNFDVTTCHENWILQHHHVVKALVTLAGHKSLCSPSTILGLTVWRDTRHGTCTVLLSKKNSNVYSDS